jgi:hypothetical protein
VHAETAITFASEASTIHYGDIGVSPGTAVTSVQVLNLVNGEIINGNTEFEDSVTSAWNAALATDSPTFLDMEIGGKTFTPGTYRSESTINIVHGTFVTLDGEGNPAAEFLFIGGSSMTTAANTYFFLINGAKAENVVWALQEAVTLGAGSVLEGSILAGTSITLGERAVLHGCALAQAAVTFESAGLVTFDSVESTSEIEYESFSGGTCDSQIVSSSTGSVPQSDSQPMPISQPGLCQNYAVNARTTVTFASSVSSVIHNGDVGVSPGTSVTNVAPIDFENGTINNGDISFAASVVAAHFAAIQVQPDSQTMEIEMGGVTFTPGTYRSGSAINFAYNTVVTLDGLNQANPTWLFQAGSTLVTAANTQFILKNGAKAENVLWALGTAATLGANSVLEGSILAGTAITFGTGSELHGCALAQSAVTFESGGKVILPQGSYSTLDTNVNQGSARNRALLRGPN